MKSDTKKAIKGIIILAVITVVAFDIFLFKSFKNSTKILLSVYHIFENLFNLIMIAPIFSIPFTIYLTIEIFLFYQSEDTLALRLYKKVITFIERRIANENTHR
jgi:hypothetical protein